MYIIGINYLGVNTQAYVISKLLFNKSMETNYTLNSLQIENSATFVYLSQNIQHSSTPTSSWLGQKVSIIQWHAARHTNPVSLTIALMYPYFAR